MATIVCIPPLDDALSDLGITMPGVGRLEFLKDSIDKIPRPSEYILKALNNMSPALSPVFTMLRIIQVVQAILNCIKATKKSISQLNPGPLIGCFRGLFEAFANLLPLIPPLSYVKLVADIMTALRLLIEDMLNVIVIIDTRISTIKAIIERGYDTDDPNLISIGNCAKDDLNEEAATILQLMRMLGLVIGSVFTIMEIIGDLLPGPAGDKIKSVGEQLSGAQADTQAVSLGDFPPLGAMQTTLMGLRDVCAMIELIANTALGKATQSTAFLVQDLQNA